MKWTQAPSTFFKEKKELYKKRGFILLFAVLSIGFLLAITVSLADSLYKQHKFLSFSSESLDALNNSNAGLECAMYWDRKFDAFNISKTSDIFCGRQKFTVGGVNVSTFTLLNDDKTQSTVVTVDKNTQPGTTTIKADGYNTTDITSEKRVSRSFTVAYPNTSQLKTCDAFDVILVLDSSDSINETERTQLNDAARTIVDGLVVAPTKARLGVVVFHHYAEKYLSLSSNPDAIKTAITNGLYGPREHGTASAGGTIKGRIELQQNARPNTPRYLLFITDGEATKCANANGDAAICPGFTKDDIPTNYPYPSTVQWEDEAKKTREANNIKIIVVGVGLEGKKDPVHHLPYEQEMQQFITSDGMYHSIASFDDLIDVVKIFNCQYFAQHAGTPEFKEE